jgi:uncharacterized protein (TIGR02117 family)
MFAVALLAACSGKPYVVEPKPDAVLARSDEISLVRHAWHVGLIVPGPVLNEAVPELEERFGTPNYYEVGWGEKAFYQAEEVTSGLTLQALFWSEGAALHVVALHEAPERYFAGEPIVKTCLSENELASLKQFLSASFTRSSSGYIKPVRAGLYGDSQFYDGAGRFDLLNTCNKWTAKALRSSGLDIQPGLRLTAESVMHYLEKHRRPCTN